jgi:hypothetical protein
VERETGILTEADSYDWIAFLPMAMALELTTVQPLLREAGHGQDEDPRSFGPQKRHARVRAPDAERTIRGSG